MTCKELYSDLKRFREGYLYCADRITRDSFDELIIDKYKHLEEDWTKGIETS